jgi:diguanylate cyclase (GGDEF)-like protein
LRVARHLAAATDSEAVLTRMLEEAVKVLGGDGGGVYRWDPERDGLVTLYSVAPAGAVPATFVPLGQGAAGQAAEQRRPVIVNDYQRAASTSPWAVSGGVEASVAVVLLHDGRLIGALAVMTYTPGKQFTVEDAEVLEILASITSSILVNLERADQLRRLAERDYLTGLANRQKAVNVFTNLMVLARRHAVSLTLAILDLDHFKQVNDRHGHSAGDAALRHLAALLQASFRDSDVVARWGGEEFLIGMYDCGGQEAAGRFRQALATLQADTLIGCSGEPFRLSFSAGIAEYPAVGTSFEALVDAADRALYAAKAQGRARVVVADCTARAQTG